MDRSLDDPNGPDQRHLWPQTPSDERWAEPTFNEAIEALDLHSVEAFVEFYRTQVVPHSVLLDDYKRLRGFVKTLHAALEPFAKIVPLLDGDSLTALVPSLTSEMLAFKIPIDFGKGQASFSIGDLRRAREAWEQSGSVEKPT